MKGTPLASRVAQGVSGPSSSCVWNPRVFLDDARGWQCPFVLCLHPQGQAVADPGHSRHAPYQHLKPCGPWACPWWQNDWKQVEQWKDGKQDRGCESKAPARTAVWGVIWIPGDNGWEREKKAHHS